MSGAEPALVAAIMGSTAASVVQGQQQMRAQKRASRQARGRLSPRRGRLNGSSMLLISGRRTLRH